MSCPRCGFTGAEGPSCPRCGVIFSKLNQERPRPTRPLAPEPAAPSPSPGTGTSVVWYFLLAGALILAAAGWLRTPKPAPPPIAAAPVEVRPTPVDAAPTLDVPQAAAPAMPAPDAPKAGSLTPEDHATFTALAAKINSRAVTAADIEVGVALHARHTGDPSFERLVTELLLSAAFEQLTTRRFAEGIALLRRAVALPWADDRARHALLTTLMSASDWRGTEEYASQLLAADSRDAEAWYALGMALFKMDRNRDAQQALRSCLAVQPHDQAQALLARIQQTTADEKGMTEQNLSHFHVRYDGDEHVEVGREIVTALERHYATLITSFDHRPENAIPVILFSRQQYHRAAGAPIWAGGSYDALDGRIRVPIGGLTRSLTPDLDSTLMHELTHAFIADKSRGIAPRDVHEGMAQYMEGERVSSSDLAELARGNSNSVAGFYLSALSFVEYLVGQRGLGGMNDLIKAMGETGSANDAFRRVYGQDQDAMRRAWFRRLQQQHGG
jgi:tetratricopeptide (TPR) repeat protein